jgi:acetoin utilization deacetylase AcuC-like enzyme
MRMAERARRSVGATIAACRVALREGVAANLAGGTHHAYAHKGGGLLRVQRRAAVAARLMQAEAPPRGAAAAAGWP